MFITRDLPRATIRGGQGNNYIFTIPTVTGQGAAQARALGAPTGPAPVKGAQRAAVAMRERGFQSMGSGARALRKYACEQICNLGNFACEQRNGTRDDTYKNCTPREGPKGHSSGSS
eukprot:6195997-Pleurochrysis_carterae.AAC.1